MSTEPATFAAVSCRVTLSFGDQALRARQLLRGALPYEPSAGEVSFEILAADEAARFTHLASSGERLWTMVRRAGTRASSVWDHHLRMVVELAHDQVSLVVVLSPGKVGLRTRSAGDQAVAEVEVDDANAGRLRQVLHFPGARNSRGTAPRCFVCCMGAGPVTRDPACSWRVWSGWVSWRAP